MTGMFLGFFLAAFYVLISDSWRNASEDNEWKRLLLPIMNGFRSSKARAVAPSER